ncbi:DUF3871 family protein [Bacteroides timonensis]|uniref:DUF3871 family protein n=1 Tax=Bacteroides timonensis TaxID=1470345 RepID=UPI0004BCA9A9|nr:DUF3871 family protein [Bacteroides timonensis]
METLEIMPIQAQRRTLNLNEYAEDATLVMEEPAKEKRPLFIEANTVDVTMEHLKQECIIPVFAKDNEATLSHPAFIETVQDATGTFFKGERIEQPDIRVSHVIKGRIPEAIHKPANQLLESDKTIYYERCAFVIEIPTIYETVNGNRLTLTVGGVRAYNHTNLYGRKGAERFKVFIGFTCKVCTNLCVSTDGYLTCLEVTNTNELYRAVLELLNRYDPAKHIHLMQTLGNSYLTEHQFCQLLGRMRLYQLLPQNQQKAIPRMLLTDTQVNNVAKSYINDVNFGGLGSELSMWKFYNLLTGANKSSYIDSFLDRAYNATELAAGINAALHGEEKYNWFLN